MKYMTKVLTTGSMLVIPIGTLSATVKPDDAWVCFHWDGFTVNVLHSLVRANSLIWEPIPDRLTSEQEDEAARRFMWVPRYLQDFYYVDSSIFKWTWKGDLTDWKFLRAGMVFKTQSEALRAAELMRKSFLRIG